MKKGKSKIMMNEWHDEFIQTLRIFEKKSKCEARKVCAIIVKDNNILSIGINGSLPGKTNCCDKFKKINNQWFKIKDDIEYTLPNSLEKVKVGRLQLISYDDNNPNSHHMWALINEIHAEINAIYKANKLHNNISGSTMYVSYCPCINCAKILALYGISKIIYVNDYDDDRYVIPFLLDNDIMIGKYNFISNEVDYWNNEIKIRKE